MGRKDLTADTWGTFAERAARSVTTPTPTPETTVGSPAPPPPPGLPSAGPPPAEGGPWAWMDLPDGVGAVVVRAVLWVRSSSGAWVLQVTAPDRKAITDWVAGGWEPGPVDEYCVFPGTRVRPIPGQDYSGLRRDGDGQLIP
ncbi:hypothetical protein LO772_26900 [Yinghuangia sp. ASG 101]|uniref:hypothetical protein n=1 Tax=Yinghuangia sp. ASG 101 TaxID=2896848 RepID=UPI001E2923CF|nr:hypothetical protein [Yinghuangia sp. ASG 101]UGQ10449.1 hypothetical protein LO772_26900 [Yinghuangia sp. ASG 101]